MAFLSVLTVISIAVLNQQSGEIRQQPWEIKGRSCCSVRQVPHTFIAKITYFLRTKSSFPWSKLWEKLGIEGITSSPSHWAQASTPDSLTVSFFVTCSNNQWDFFFFFLLQHTSTHSLIVTSKSANSTQKADNCSFRSDERRLFNAFMTSDRRHNQHPKIGM